MQIVKQELRKRYETNLSLSLLVLEIGKVLNP